MFGRFLTSFSSSDARRLTSSWICCSSVRLPSSVSRYLRAALRRSGWTAPPPSQGIRTFGTLEIDLDGHVVRQAGSEVRLTPTEFALLAQLVSNPGKVLTHRMLLQRIWGAEYGDEAEYLRVYMGRLRRKLEPDPAKPRYLLTEPGVGYRFMPA